MVGQRAFLRHLELILADLLAHLEPALLLESGPGQAPRRRPQPLSPDHVFGIECDQSLAVLHPDTLDRCHAPLTLPDTVPHVRENRTGKQQLPRYV